MNPWLAYALGILTPYGLCGIVVLVIALERWRMARKCAKRGAAVPFHSHPAVAEAESEPI